MIVYLVTVTADVNKIMYDKIISLLFTLEVEAGQQMACSEIQEQKVVLVFIKQNIINAAFYK